MRHMSANRQWKVVDERYSGNVFTDDHWYSTYIPRIVRVKTTQTTQKIRKTAQYCANFYAKPSFELLKTWNRVKHRYGEHRRTTAEVPRQKNWWNAQIADVSRKTRNLCVIHAFTRIFGSVTGPLHNTLTITTLRSQKHQAIHGINKNSELFLKTQICTYFPHIPPSAPNHKYAANFHCRWFFCSSGYSLLPSPRTHFNKIFQIVIMIKFRFSHI